MTRFTVAAVAACAALAEAEVARALGIAVPRGVFALVASVTAVLAATVAVRQVAFVWRGPVVVSFRRSEGTLCDARESAAIRSAAQLRGTMGGAGHLHPRRLALSALAWGAAAVQAIALLLPHRSAATFVPLAVVLLAAGLAARFPATPFFYREAAGGCVVAFPSGVCSRLLEAAPLGPAPAPLELEPTLRDPPSPAAPAAPAPLGESAERRHDPTR